MKQETKKQIKRAVLVAGGIGLYLCTSEYWFRRGFNVGTVNGIYQGTGHLIEDGILSKDNYKEFLDKCVCQTKDAGISVWYNKLNPLLDRVMESVADGTTKWSV